jgi:hypothetical protein
LLLELARIGREQVVVVEAGVFDVAGAVRLRGQRTVDPSDRMRDLVVTAPANKR